MSDETQVFAAYDQSLDDLLAECIAAEEAGRPVDFEGLIARHPQYAADLREFFANRAQMDRLAGPLRPSDPRAARSRAGSLGTIRYFGDYELLEEIAAGGMGIVYKARQVSLNRIVAVKMILKGSLATEEDVRRFRAEAEAAASLQHPGIVAIHEIGLHEGQHYFSMDFVEGCDLSQLIHDQPLSGRQAAEYLRAAAETVHYAHQQGTLHRDLKPSNILIDKQNRVRITDFGLAKRIENQSELTLTGQILGTPSYMPPEQALGKRALVSTASDVYSLGAVLYEMLAGRPPFRGENPTDTLRQVESLDPVSPRLLSPSVPRDLETICLKCLEKEPHKRYGTAHLLADDLARFLRSEPLLARPTSRSERAWRWCRRNPTTAVLSTALVVSLLAGTFLSTYFAWKSLAWARNAGIQANKASAAAALATAESNRAKTKAAEAARLASQEATARGHAEQATKKYETALGSLNEAQQRLRSVDLELAQRKQELHRTTIQLARAALQAHRPDEALQHLDLIPEEAQTWESRFIRRLAQPLLWQDADATCIAFGVDRRLLAVATRTRSIEIRDVATCNVRYRLSVDHSPYSLAFGPRDEGLLFNTGHTTYWRFDDNRLLPLGRSDSFVIDVDREQVTTIHNSESRVSVFDLREGLTFDPILTFHVPKAVLLAPRGDMVVGQLVDASSKRGTLQIHDLRNGTHLICVEPTTDEGRPAKEWETFSFSADGKLLSAARRVTYLYGQHGQNVRTQVGIWETRTGSLQRTLKLDHVRPVALCLSPNARDLIVATTSESAIRRSTFKPEHRVSIWDLTLAKVVRALPQSSAPRGTLTATPDGRWLSTLGENGAEIWNISAPGEGLVLGRHAHKVHSVAISPNGRWIAACSAINADDVVTVWDAETGVEAFQLPESHQCDQLEFSPDGKYLASAGRKSGLWDFSSRTLLADLGNASGVAFNQDGTQLALTHGSRTHLWDISTRSKLTTFPDGGHGVNFYDAGRKLVISGTERGVAMWDAARVERMWHFDRRGCYRTAVSPDQKTIAVGLGGANSAIVHLLDAATGKSLRSWQTSWDNDYVVDLRYSPDGETLATVNYSAIRVWNAHTGDLILDLTHPEVSAPHVQDRPYAIAFSADGKQLISGWGHILNKQLRGTVLMWNTLPGAQSPELRWLVREGGLFPPAPTAMSDERAGQGTSRDLLGQPLNSN